MPIHNGSCHCGKVRFEIDAEIDHVRVCDCSVCLKRGALNFRIPKENFNLLTPWNDLSLYQWGTRTGKDFFCSKCGILPFRRPSYPTPEERENGTEVFDGWAVNVRCLDDLDIESLVVKNVCGRKIKIDA